MSTVFGDGTPIVAHGHIATATGRASATVHSLLETIENKNRAIALLMESVKYDNKPLAWILPALIAALSRQQTQTPMEEPEDTFVIKWFRRQGPHV